MTPRKRPALTDRPIPHRNNGHAKPTQYRAGDGFAAPDAQDRADQRVIAAVTACGYRIAVPCIICGSWLTNPRSVAAHVGPVCRKRVQP